MGYRRDADREAEGLTGAGWNEKVFTFPTNEGAAALDQALTRFEGGRPGVAVGFVPTDEHTLQSKVAPNLFVIGDAEHFLAGELLEATFDGHANCFIETGHHKALLIDFNYDTEPQPGHYPRWVGLLLKDSRLTFAGVAVDIDELTDRHSRSEVHARRVLREGHRAHGPSPRQGLRRLRQRAL